MGVGLGEGIDGPCTNQSFANDLGKAIRWSISYQSSIWEALNQQMQLPAQCHSLVQ